MKEMLIIRNAIQRMFISAVMERRHIGRHLESTLIIDFIMLNYVLTDTNDNNCMIQCIYK